MSPTHDWIRTPLTADVVRGALELEPTARGVQPHRLPAWARAQGADAQLSMVESQPAGVRLAFRTTATVIELDALPTRYSYVGAPARPDGVYDLVIDGRLTTQASVAGGTTVAIDMATGVPDVRAGEPGTIRFDGLEPRSKDVELWLPHTETTELVELRTDAPMTPLVRARPTWVHHGSSISHGSNATSPSATWPALAAAASNVELVNLGFGGSAMLDPFVARVIRDLPADLVSVKIGINLVNADVMRLRAFGPAVHGFLDTIRDGHPDTPLVVVSPIYCPIHEDTPGPGAFDMAALADGRMRFRATGDPAGRAAGKLTLRAIRDELARIVAQRSADDPHLTYVDGLDLYGEADFAEVPLPDALHPDTAGHARIGARFAERVLAQPPAVGSGRSGAA